MLLIVAAFVIAESRVVGQSCHAVAAQLGAEFIDALAGQTINDARAAGTARVTAAPQ